MLVLFVSREVYGRTWNAGTCVALMGGKIQWNNIDDDLAMMNTYTGASVSTREHFY